jgi:hypothetical protein
MRLWIPLGSILALVLFLGDGAGRDACAQEKSGGGRQLLRETNSQEVLSSMTLLNNRPESLKNFEQELSKPLTTFRPELDRDLPLPYSPRAVVVPNSRAQANWLTPSDLMPKTDQGDWLSGMYGKKEQPKSSQDQLLMMLTQDPARNPGSDNDPLSSRNRLSSGAPDGVGLPMGGKDRARDLRELSRGSGPNLVAPGGQGGLGDFNWATGSGLTREQMRAHKDYMETFRREVLGSTPVPPPATGVNPLNVLPQSPLSTPAAAPSSGYGSGLDGFASTAPRRGMEATLDAYNPALLNPGHDLNTALQQWNPLYTTPRLEPQKVAPSTPAIMEVPKRRF